MKHGYSESWASAQKMDPRLNSDLEESTLGVPVQKKQFGIPIFNVFFATPTKGAITHTEVRWSNPQRLARNHDEHNRGASRHVP